MNRNKGKLEADWLDFELPPRVDVLLFRPLSLESKPTWRRLMLVQSSRSLGTVEKGLDY